MSSHAAATAAAQGNLSTDPETLACGERVFNTHGGGAVAGGAAFSVLTRLRAIQLMEVQGKAPAVLDPSLFRPQLRNNYLLLFHGTSLRSFVSFYRFGLLVGT